MAWAQNAMSRDVSHAVTPCLRLEPLPKGIDQAHQRDRRLADLGCQLDKVIKGLLGFGVEDLIPTQRVETSGFI